jgi:EmrB/QacA subfamily drug resistance transporter
MDTNMTSRRWALIIASTAFFMAALDLLVVATALPAIHRGLHADAGTLEWTINAYGIVAASGIVTAASLGDRFGRRRVFSAGLVVFSVASALCALAPGGGVLVAARALQGAGAAVIAPLSLTILSAAFPPERRGVVIGLWGGLAGLAIAAGPLVGGAITQGLSWHWVFWVNVPIGLAAARVGSRMLTESRGLAGALDLPAGALVTAGACGLVWGLTEAGRYGRSNPSALAGLGLGAAALAGFVRRERSAPHPMLPLRLFTSRRFVAVNLVAFLTNAALLPGAMLLAEYLQLGLLYSPFAAGVRFLPMTAAPVVVAPLAGKLANRVGPRPLMVWGLVVFAGGLLWLALAAGGTYLALVPALVICGVGVSMPFATVPAASISSVDPHDIGTASGATNTLQRLGGAFGLAIVTAAFSATGGLGSPHSFLVGFRAGELAAAALAGLGVLSAAFVGAAATRTRVAERIPGPAALATQR